jgi:hypothetical protein
VQNVHTKRWRNETVSDKIELRKNVGLEDFYDTSKHKHNPDGTIVVSRCVERKLPRDVEALEVIDVVSVKGDVSRTFFDEKGRRRMRIDNCDHGFPTKHPMGAHKHIIVYDEDGNYVKDTKPITLKAKDRKENADIL